MRPLQAFWVLTPAILPLLFPAFHAAKAVRTAAAQAATTSAATGASAISLGTSRESPSDLEIGGELAGLPAGSTRYVTLNALLALPQTTYTVSDDPSFVGATKISGVPLAVLARLLGASPQSDMLVAICDDKYRANYPRAYVAAHHPLLVLKVNGELPPRWPKDADTHSSMGPYLISNPRFTPSFKILAHADEPQIPWGVIRLEFRNEEKVFGAVAPRGPHVGDAAVQAGYRIAQQNCCHCHNMGDEGGQKAGRPWMVLSAWAAGAPEYFSAYVRDPKKKNPKAQMPENPGYDDATIAALRAYFATFVTAERP